MLGDSSGKKWVPPAIAPEGLGGSITASSLLCLQLAPAPPPIHKAPWRRLPWARGGGVGGCSFWTRWALAGRQRGGAVPRALVSSGVSASEVQKHNPDWVSGRPGGCPDPGARVAGKNAVRSQEGPVGPSRPSPCFCFPQLYPSVACQVQGGGGREAIPWQPSSPPLVTHTLPLLLPRGSKK